MLGSMAPSTDPRRPRVLMVGPAPDGRGGIAAQTATLLRSSLPRRVRLRHVATHREGSAVRRAASGWRGLRRVRRALAAGDVDLVHVMLSSHGSFWRKAAVVSAARRAGTPIVIHVHGGVFDRYRDRSPLHAAAVRRLLDAADAVLVLTDGWRNLVRGYTACPRIEVLPNPVELPRREGPAVPTPGVPTVLLVGRLDARKGVDVLLDAVPRVLERGPPARFVLAGDGMVRSIRRQVWRRGLDDHVHLPGWLERPERDDALRRAALLVLPSRNEGLPLSVLEAMAAGLPVVATDIEGHRSAIAHGRGGYLVPPGDAAALARRLRALLDDAELRARMGAFNRDRARRRYDAEIIAARLEHIYRDLTWTRSSR